MAVERIEEYRQKNGVDILKVILKPTRKYPNGGYFYAPTEAIELIKRYTWCLESYGKRICVTAYNEGTYRRYIIRFHQKLFEFYQGYTWSGDIDHINLVEFDNTDENLNAVTHQQNQYNRPTRGYSIPIERTKSFYPRIRLNIREYLPLGGVRTESEACTGQDYIEKVWLKDQLGNQYYMFDFKKYRRGSKNILDLERTGVISEEEAIYRHILRYSGNAWYMLRYGLEQYYKDNHIPIPEYRLDERGFMIHPITGQKLCPF